MGFRRGDGDGVVRQALKLGLHRKFSDHLGLVKEAMKIFLRSSVLLMVLVRT